tara:strand:+ start:398 stop:841 length:444 start_codon:yes stop_codon:yes gene_type:complete
MATYYKAEEMGIPIKPKNGKEFTLEEMQTLVGGYIETFPLGKDLIVVVNEEGRCVEEPVVNVNFMDDFSKYGWTELIFGHVLVAPRKMVGFGRIEDYDVTKNEDETGIDRLKAENERLKADNERLKAENEDKGTPKRSRRTFETDRY